MAREVVLSFRLRAIKAAETAAKGILTKIRKSKDLAKEVKRDLVEQGQTYLQSIRAQKRAEVGRVRLEKRAAGRGLREFGGTPSSLGGTFSKIGQVGGIASAAADLFSPDADLVTKATSVASIALALAKVNPAVAAAIAAFQPIYEAAISASEARIKQEMAVLESRFIGELERLRAAEPLNEFERRLEEDPEFARTAQRNFANKARADGVGWGSGGDFLDGF